MEVLNSNQDNAVNFIRRENGILESRYVERDDYFVCYLSSHTGCNMACRFCHLTATGQTHMRDASLEELLDQASPILKHNMGKIKKMHYNFMARGEPLASETITENWKSVHSQLEGMAVAFAGVEDVKFKISTIMPETFHGNLEDRFGPEVELYYSLYSLRPEFRRRWLPKAMEPYTALRKLRNWQRRTGGKVVIHHPFIEDENDNYFEVLETVNAVLDSGLDTRFNCVRYNPPNSKSKESDFYEDCFDLWRDFFPNSKIIARVGYDVKASCGMFVT